MRLGRIFEDEWIGVHIIMFGVFVPIILIIVGGIEIGYISYKFDTIYSYLIFIILVCISYLISILIGIALNRKSRRKHDGRN